MIREGTRLTWDWGQGTAEGVVETIFREPVERVIQGTTVRRKASADEPAYLIVQDDGQTVLKSATEVRRADDS